MPEPDVLLGGDPFAVRGGGGGGASRESSTTTTDSDAIRPDPRWASELEKLKQMLAAQTTN